LAKKDGTLVEAETRSTDPEYLRKKIELLDSRLDNIDSTVSVVAERVMNQIATFTVTCSHCGKEIEIALIGTSKPKSK
jgi:hypothetical protein